MLCLHGFFSEVVTFSFFWILFYAWTVSEREGLGLAVNSRKYACSRDSYVTKEQSWSQELSNDSTTLALSVIAIILKVRIHSQKTKS